MRVEENGDATRPYAYADSRSLSQAWYDALHRSSEHSHVSHDNAHASRPAHDEDLATIPSEHTNVSRAAYGPRVFTAREAAQRARENGLGRLDRTLIAALERARAAAMPQAGSRPLAGRSDFEFVDESGTKVRFLLQQTGDQLHVVAVAAPEAGARIAEALARARTALRAHGITLSHEIHERGHR